MKKILIGKINSVFGIKGEVKIVSYCQNPTDIEKYALFDDKGNEIKLRISNKNKAIVGSSADGAILIAKITGIDDRNQAELLRGRELFAARENFAKKLKKNEFYQVDLIGLDVINEQGDKIGKVLNVLDFGGGVMLEIEFEKANLELKLEKIENFPFKNEFFPDVDVEEGFVRIVLPEVVQVK